MTTSKLNLERIALSFESKRKKKTVRSHKANDSNEIRVPTRSFSPADDREVPAQESGNGPLFFWAW